MSNVLNFNDFVNESESKSKTIENFPYVINFFSKYYPDKLKSIRNIPVYIISEEDWPDGKPRQTENDRNGGIRIHQNHVEYDKNVGWLIHEVGHVLDLNGERKEYLVDKKKFNHYPNEDDEQTPMFYQFHYLIDNGLSEDDVIKLEKSDYSNIKGGGTLWNAYKEEFFREYYRNFKNSPLNKNIFKKLHEFYNTKSFEIFFRKSRNPHDDIVRNFSCYHNAYFDNYEDALHYFKTESAFSQPIAQDPITKKWCGHVESGLSGYIVRNEEEFNFALDELTNYFPHLKDVNEISVFKSNNYLLEDGSDMEDTFKDAIYLFNIPLSTTYDEFQEILKNNK